MEFGYSVVSTILNFYRRANYAHNRDTILDNNKLYKQNQHSTPTPSSTLIPTDSTPTPSSTLIPAAVQPTSKTNIPSNKRKIETLSTKTTSLEDYFTKNKTKHNENDKPP